MPENQQPKFSEAALDEYRQTLERYPTRQAALIPTLWIAQREFGWLSDATQDYVAQLMELPPAHVRAVCTNLSCKLRGAEKIVDCIRRKLKIELGETTPDGKFTLDAVECLASCGTAPMLQLNQDAYFENLTEESTLKLIDELASRDN